MPWELRLQVAALWAAKDWGLTYLIRVVARSGHVALLGPALDGIVRRGLRLGVRTTVVFAAFAPGIVADQLPDPGPLGLRDQRENLTDLEAATIVVLPLRLAEDRSYEVRITRIEEQ